MSDDNGEVYRKRDIILAEIHSTVKNLDKSFSKHEEFDEERFKDVNSKLNKGVWIAIVVLIIVAANGGMEAIRTLFKLGG